MQSREETRGTQLAGTAASILIGAAMALGICCLLLLAAAAGISTGKIPENAMGTAVIACCALSAVVGGAFAVGRGDGPPILIGLLTGATLCLLLLAVGWAAFTGLSFGSESIGVLVAALAGGTLSALLPRGRKHRRKKK